MNCFSKSFKKSNSHCKDFETGWNMSFVKGVRRNNPCNEVTLDNTTYNQFGTNDISDKIKTSLVIPCNLCPVVASDKFTANWHILKPLILA